MSILIQFEDENGCTSLFETSNIFKNTRNNITIRRGLGNSGVYRIGKKKALNFDRIIIIFDLDALSTKNIKDNASLSTESFIEMLKENGIIDEQLGIKDMYNNKIAFIPVEFCFETIYLYSNHLIDILKNVNNYGTNQNIEILKCLKEYYDYTNLHPEYFEGADCIAEDIHKDICSIRGNKASDIWKASKYT